MKSLDFALLLSKYLTQYLPAQRNLSSNTICSYRDTFKLLLIFCRDIQGFNIAKLPMTQLDRKCIEDFILWLRNIRKSSPSTCNQRLCAIHAFFDYVMVEEPQFMEQCIQIHNIPKMVSSAPPAKYLTPDALRCLLATPDITTPKGRRHLVLLTVLYDTAARVSELADIRMRDVRLDSPAAITLHGKGGKVRTVPLMKQTVELLQSYFTENGITPQKSPDMPLFWSGNYRKLTRSGITYIVQKYAAAAQAISTDIPATISPHVFRHTKAMHLVQANVNTVYIKDYLGHADISTTEIYARADNEAKHAALEKASLCSGITYIVQKYAAAAQAISTDIPATISPHVFRHTKAMHLVQANVNTVYIKDYLGHADISTTEIYARADNEAKHAALEKASLCLELPCASNWEQDADLIAWLSSLG